METISFKEFGSSLCTRSLGKKLREDITTRLTANTKTVFDFEGVKTVSNSFADECFAKLLFEFDLEYVQQNTTFKNTNPFITKCISVALKQRLGQMVLA
jgi:hypothetical protein